MHKTFANRIRKWVGLGPIQIVVALFLYWASIYFFWMLDVDWAHAAMTEDGAGWALFVILPLIVLIGSAFIRSVLRK